jgi:hypothetical protein
MHNSKHLCPRLSPKPSTEAVAEVDKMQTMTQQMVDQVFSFSELGSRNSKPLEVHSRTWEQLGNKH